jgi:hypothetical protein
MSFKAASNGIEAIYLCSHDTETDPVTSIKLFAASGNLSGELTLYGEN